MEQGTSKLCDLDRLTEAQRRVLLADPTGNSKRVAKKLGISPHTVDGHFRAIIHRLGVSDRLEAVARAHASRGQSLSAQPPRVAPGSESYMLGASYELPRSPTVMGLQDAAALDRGSWEVEEVSLEGGRKGRDRHSPLWVVSQIVLIAVGLVIIGSAALPLGQGFEALANLILNLHQR